MGYIPQFEPGATRRLTEPGETYRPPKEVQEKVSVEIVKNQLEYKKRYGAKRNTKVKYNVGDIVYIKTYVPATGEGTKQHKRFREPYVVSKVLRGDTYVIDHLAS